MHFSLLNRYLLTVTVITATFEFQSKETKNRFIGLFGVYFRMR